LADQDVLATTTVLFALEEDATAFSIFAVFFDGAI